MKFKWNSKYLTISAYAAGTIVLCAVVILAILHLDVISQKLAGFTVTATPIIIGIFCAYLLNPLMMKFEKGLFKKWADSSEQKLKSRARMLSLTITMTVVLLILVILIILIIPQLITNIVAIFSNLDTYAANIQSFLAKLAEDYPQLADFLDNPLDDLTKFLTNIWNEYSEELLGFVGNVTTGIWSVLDALKNIFFGLTLSIYLLAKKEMFVGQSKKLLFAFVKADRAQRFLKICSRASEKFLGSIVGKILESLIIAFLIFVGCAIMRMPYSLLMGVIMFIFQLIPVVGAIIGCVPCCLLLLLSGKPMLAVWFVVIAMVMQTVDGNFVGPWILGDKTGLPAVWVLISILLGGGLFGVVGMVLAVPVFAVIYMLIKDFVESRLKKRKLPCSTEKYVGNVDYITSDYVFEEEEPEENTEPKKKLSFLNIKLGKKQEEAPKTGEKSEKPLDKSK